MTMSFATSLLTALFMMCIVFFVLVLLWAFLRILGAIFVARDNAKKLAEAAANQPAQNI